LLPPLPPGLLPLFFAAASHSNEPTAQLTLGISGLLRSAICLSSGPSVNLTQDQFRQLIVAVDPAPTFLGAFDKLEDQGERGLVRHAAL
jgi:hypothetical protein